MIVKNFIRIGVMLAGLVTCVHADDWLSTATGGAFPNGYAGSLITTSTQVIRGSVICKQGFQVPSSGALLYDADGLVYGKVEFTGSDGTLILASDLRLGATAMLRSTEVDAYLTVTGGSRKTDPTSNRIILGGDTRLTFSLRIYDNSLVIDGRGHTLELDAPILLENTLIWPTYLTLQNMRLVIKNAGLSGASVTPFQVSAVSPTNCRIILQDVDVCLPTGRTVQWPGSCYLYFKNKVRLLGSGGTFKASYTSGSEFLMYIDENSSLYVGPGVTLSFWGAEVSSNVKLGFAAGQTNSSLWLDGCMLDISTTSTLSYPPGLRFASTGTVYFDNKVTVSSTVAGAVETQMQRDGSYTGLSFQEGYVDVRVRSGAYINAIGPISYTADPE